MNHKFTDFMQKYKNDKLAVAVSGGLDSVCLVHWLAKLNLDVTVLHVNHGLRDAADVETKYVLEIAEKLNLPCETFFWDGEKPATGLESAARDARYTMMTDYCRKNNIGFLLTAHQADDQIETFLMNLGRGSGVYGLAGMRSETMRDGVKIVRPLLNVFRSELKKYCDENNIKYFNDEMNVDEKYTRVKIRQNRGLLASLLGISDERILLAITNLGRTRDAIDKEVTECIKKIDTMDSHLCGNKRVVFSESFLFDLSNEFRLKLLGRVIEKIGRGNYQPRLNSLENALVRLGGDCKFTLGGCTIRRLGGQILIVREGDSVSFKGKRKNAKSEKKEIVQHKQ